MSGVRPVQPDIESRMQRTRKMEPTVGPRDVMADVRAPAFDLRQCIEHHSYYALANLSHSRKALPCTRSSAEEREHVVLLTTEHAR